MTKHFRLISRMRHRLSYLLSSCRLLLLFTFFIIIAVSGPIKLISELPEEGRNQVFDRQPVKNNLACFTSFDLVGYYATAAAGLTKLNSSLATRIVKKLSPEMNEAVPSLFPMSEIDNKHLSPHILSPGFTYIDGGRKLYTVSRIWLEITHPEPKGSNLYFANYIAEQTFFSSNSTPASTYSLVPLAIPRQYGDEGPSDPRVFKLRSKIFIQFYMKIVTEEGEQQGRLFLWDTSVRHPVLLRITDAGYKSAVIESNWVPFEQEKSDDWVHYIYSFNPMLIVRCSTVDGNCTFVTENPEKLNAETIRWILPLLNPNDGFEYKQGLVIRGGTPMVPMATQNGYSYYFGAVHSMVKRRPSGSNAWKRHYGAHFVLTRMKKGNFSTACIVYISGQIQINMRAFDESRLVHSKHISGKFIYPVGLALEPEGCLLLSYHVSDDRSYFSRYCGIHDLLQSLLTVKDTVCLRRILTKSGLDKLVYDMSS